MVPVVALYVGKLIMAVLLTPLISLGHHLFRRMIPERDTPPIESPAFTPAP